MTDLNQYLEDLVKEAEAKGVEAARVDGLSFAELAHIAGIKLAAGCSQCPHLKEKGGAMDKCTSCDSKHVSAPKDVEYVPPSEEAGGQGKEAAMEDYIPLAGVVGGGLLGAGLGSRLGGGLGYAAAKGRSPMMMMLGTGMGRAAGAGLGVAGGGAIGTRILEKILLAKGKLPLSDEKVQALAAQGKEEKGDPEWNLTSEESARLPKTAAKRDMPPFLEQDRPKKVKEIYSAIKREHPDMPAEMKARIAARQGKKGKQKQGPPYKGPLTQEKSAAIADSAGRVLAKVSAPINLTREDFMEAAQEAKGREDIPGRSRRWALGGGVGGGLLGGGLGLGVGHLLKRKLGPAAQIAAPILGAAGGGVVGAGAGRRHGAEEAAADILVSRMRQGQAMRRGALMGYLTGRRGGQGLTPPPTPVESTHTQNIRQMSGALSGRSKEGSALPFPKGR